ncbi:MAG: hypothetical protein R2780_09305 [Crocinitomicaceae bacterium]|nr:hypothetical protein [Crocinitomicaceae bacterium]
MKNLISYSAISIFFISIQGFNFCFGQVENLFVMIEKESKEPQSLYSLEDLTLGVVPTNYVISNELHDKGESKPIRLYIDMNSLNFDWNKIKNSGSIEVIVIQINQSSELSIKIDIGQFKKFESLKYIYISSSIELCSLPDDINCEKSEVEKLISGKLENVKVVYTAESNQ